MYNIYIRICKYINIYINIYIYNIYIYIYIYIYWVKPSIYIYFKGSEQFPKSIILSCIMVNFATSVLPEFNFLLSN